MKKLKERWNIETNGQLFIIFLVFAITGSSAAKLAAPLT
ncbi:MAG TPA: diacylglyceryl transferase, partial [Aequorivita sp.]|nr:diacylglyceryl transferase [Aequorivita sp.]